MNDHGARDDGESYTESNGDQTLVVVDYGTVKIVAAVNPCTTPERVGEATVTASRELMDALNGPSPWSSLKRRVRSAVSGVCALADGGVPQPASPEDGDGDA